jgi:hypothetical protein
MQGADQSLVDRRPFEAEPLQVLHHGQPRGRHDSGSRRHRDGRLSTEQVGQDLHGGALALEAGGDRLVERRRHALEARPRIVSIISCRCIIASQQIIAGTVGDRRMTQHPVFRSDDAVGCRRLAARERMLRISSSLAVPFANASRTASTGSSHR